MVNVKNQKTRGLKFVDVINDKEYINAELAKSERGGTMSFEDAYKKSQYHIDNLSF